MPPELGRNSVDEFLFETRRGFCEHYASAFVFLMRAAGIPARVVTGYQGGEMNPLSDYLIVRQSEAHAWAEVWQAGEGWVRVDPTAAVSPARIQVGIAAALPAGDPLPLGVRGNFELLRQLRFTWDAVANSWNQWVLGYTPGAAAAVAARPGISVGDMADAGGAADDVVRTGDRGRGAAGAGQAAAGCPRDPVARSWRALLSQARPARHAGAAREGPRDFARRAAVRAARSWHRRSRHRRAVRRAALRRRRSAEPESAATARAGAARCSQIKTARRG